MLYTNRKNISDKLPSKILSFHCNGNFLKFAPKKTLLVEHAEFENPCISTLTSFISRKCALYEVACTTEQR